MAEHRYQDLGDALLQSGHLVPLLEARILTSMADIARLAAMGINTYSFSISWSRIYPFGSGPINQAGIDHYNDLINTCLEYNITPAATLYHWDTPLFLQEQYGGWLSEKIVDDFVAYANTSFQAFGDRVKLWFTLNEPIVFCQQYPLPANYFKNFTIPYVSSSVPTWRLRA